MKNFFKKIRAKFRVFLFWLKNELKDRKTFIIFAIVLLVMYFPVYGFYGLAYLTKKSGFSIAATAYAAFWAGPFTPFFPLCIALTFGIKKIFLLLTGKKKDASKIKTDIGEIQRREEDVRKNQTKLKKENQNDIINKN